MSHIFFSIRTFVLAFVVLASSLLVRPLIGDPVVPGRVEQAAEAAVVEEAADRAVLASRSNTVFVGRLRRQLAAREDSQVFELELLCPLKGVGRAGEAVILNVRVGDSETVEALLALEGEALFYGLRQGDGSVALPSALAVQSLDGTGPVRSRTGR